MADGLKFFVTAIFPDTRTNMTSIQPILSSLPNSHAFSMADGTMHLEIRVTPEDIESFTQACMELADSLGLPYIAPPIAEFLGLNLLKDITGSLNLTLRFMPNS